MAADDSGLAVSLTQSLFHAFGACVLEPETGILLHNRGAGFSLVPGHPNELAGGRRPAHTLMPLLVERDGAFAGALGTMGGHAHPQIQAQVLLRLLAGETPADAIAAPRWTVDDHAGSGRVGWRLASRRPRSTRSPPRGSTSPPSPGRRRTSATRRRSGGRAASCARAPTRAPTARRSPAERAQSCCGSGSGSAARTRALCSWPRSS